MRFTLWGGMFIKEIKNIRIKWKIHILRAMIFKIFLSSKKSKFM